MIRTSLSANFVLLNLSLYLSLLLQAMLVLLMLLVYQPSMLIKTLTDSDTLDDEKDGRKDSPR